MGMSHGNERPTFDQNDKEGLTPDLLDDSNYLPHS